MYTDLGTRSVRYGELLLGLFSPVGPKRMMLTDLGMPLADGVGRAALSSQGGSGAPNPCILVRIRRANASGPHV